MQKICNQGNWSHSILNLQNELKIAKNARFLSPDIILIITSKCHLNVIWYQLNRLHCFLCSKTSLVICTFSVLAACTHRRLNTKIILHGFDPSIESKFIDSSVVLKWSALYGLQYNDALALFLVLSGGPCEESYQRCKDRILTLLAQLIIEQNDSSTKFTNYNQIHLACLAC